jgi:hypothetical protein
MSSFIVELAEDVIDNSMHGHDGNSGWDEKGLYHSPREEAAGRADNCSSTPLGSIAEFQFSHRHSRMLFCTNHVQNGHGRNSILGTIDGLFKEMMKRPEYWEDAGVAYSGPAVDMPEGDMLRIREYCRYWGTEIIWYGPERLMANLQRQASIADAYPDKVIFAGYEETLLLNGDTDGLRDPDPRLRVRILSYHPQYYEKEPSIQYTFGPKAQSRLWLEAISRHKPVIVGHLGYRCEVPGDKNRDKEKLFRRKMDLAALSRAAVENNAVWEINYAQLRHEACHSLVNANPDVYPLENDEWVAEVDRLIEKTPFLNDPESMAQLRWALDNGLLIAINDDRHSIPIIDAVPGRFDRIMERFARRLTEWLNLYGIQAEQVVNTWSAVQINDWLEATGR